MNKLFYCHKCYDIFSLNENKRECNKCSSEFIQEIQEEHDEIEEDGGSIPEPESSGLAQILLTNVEPPKPMSSTFKPVLKNISRPVGAISAIINTSNTINSPVMQGESVKTPSNVLPEGFSNPKLSVSKDSTSNSKNQVSSVDHNRLVQLYEDDSSNDDFLSIYQSQSAPQSQSDNQARTYWSGLFRSRPKEDKLINKISLKSINFTVRDDCSICLKNYQTKDFVRITQCSHKFHDSCLKSWLKVKKECPICRSQFKV